MSCLNRQRPILQQVVRLSLISIALTGSTMAMAQERIISAGSTVTEIVEALGATSQLVAIDVTSQQPSDKTLPVVGYHRQLAAEGLLALQPTRLIGSDEMGPETTLNTLKQAGVSVDIVNSQNDIAGLKKRIEEIAVLTHTQDKAKVIKDKVHQQVQTLISHQPQHKKKALFLLIHEGRPANVAGRDTTPDALIRLIGAENPASSLTSYKPISVESMVQMQPDVILVSGRSFDDLGGAQAVLDKMPMLAATPAGQHLNIIAIDGKALVGGLGLKTLAEAERIQSRVYPTQ